MINILSAIFNQTKKKYEKKGYLLEDFRLFHLKDMGEAKVDYHYHEFYKILFFVYFNQKWRAPFRYSPQFLIRFVPLCMVLPQILSQLASPSAYKSVPKTVLLRLL